MFKCSINNNIDNYHILRQTLELKFIQNKNKIIHN